MLTYFCICIDIPKENEAKMKIISHDIAKESMIGNIDNGRPIECMTMYALTIMMADE